MFQWNKAFTLIEMLLAVMLTSVIVLVLAQAMHVAVATYAKTHTPAASGRRQTCAFLQTCADYVDQAQPMVVVHADNSRTLTFLGAADSLEFTSSGCGLHYIGLAEVRIAFDSSTGTLRIAERPYVQPDSHRDEPSPFQQVAAVPVTGFAITYGIREADGSLNEADSYPAGTMRLPEWVNLRVDTAADRFTYRCYPRIRTFEQVTIKKKNVQKNNQPK